MFNRSVTLPSWREGLGMGKNYNTKNPPRPPLKGREKHSFFDDWWLWYDLIFFEMTIIKYQPQCLIEASPFLCKGRAGDG